MEFHEKLQQLRKHRGLTQEELAAALFVSRTAVSKWESGRGYPSIDSLKAVAKFFSVSIDVLLSGDELLTLAEEDTLQKRQHLYMLVSGLLDCSIALTFVLPFFGQTTGGVVQSVPLPMLTAIPTWLKAAYVGIVLAMTAAGILTIALQNRADPLRAKFLQRISPALNVAAVFLFILSRQPYAAAFTLVFLIIKIFMQFKR